MSIKVDSHPHGEPSAGWVLPTLPAVGRSPLFLGLVLVVVTLGVSAPFFNLPIPRDQGVFAACGSILLHGVAPYAACWDTKGPMTYYTYAVAQIIFGVNLAGPVILNAFIVALTGLGLWRLGRRWLGEGLGWGAGLLYALLLVTLPFDSNAQPEGFANLFIVAGVWGIVRAAETDRPWLRWVAGAALAVAVAYKYSVLLPVGVVGLAALLIQPKISGERPPWRRRLIAVLPAALEVGLGFGLMVAGFVGYLAIRGALALGLEHVVFMLTEFPKVAVNPALLILPGESGPPLFYLERTVDEFMRLPFVHLFAVAGCAVALRRRRPWAWLLSLWTLAAVASVYPQKVMSLYHWTLTLAPLSLGVGAFMWELQHGLGFPLFLHQTKRLYATLFGVALVLANVGGLFYHDRWLVAAKYITGQQSLLDFYADHGTADEIKVADYIRDRTTADDLVWVWGNHAIIYYWAQRFSPTRFIFNSPLVAEIGPNDYQPRWKEEALEALQTRPPTYIVMTYWDRTWFDYANPYEQFAAMPNYQDFLNRYYRRETGIDRFVLYRLTPWWSRYNYPSLLDATTRVDLLGQLDSAVLTSAPNQPIHQTDFKLDNELAYPTLLMPVEGKADYNLTLPGNVVCLRADLAMDPQSWGWGGDGAAFDVAVNGQRIFEKYVGNEPSDRFWQPVIVDLSQWAGQAVTLSLSTGPGPQNDFTGDLAGWGLPRIVQSPGPTCDARAISK